jgi:hypothetical protein
VTITGAGTTSLRAGSGVVIHGKGVTSDDREVTIYGELSKSPDAVLVESELGGVTLRSIPESADAKILLTAKSNAATTAKIIEISALASLAPDSVFISSEKGGVTIQSSTASTDANIRLLASSSAVANAKVIEINAALSRASNAVDISATDGGVVITGKGRAAATPGVAITATSNAAVDQAVLVKSTGISTAADSVEVSSGAGGVKIASVGGTVNAKVQLSATSDAGVTPQIVDLVAAGSTADNSISIVSGSGGITLTTTSATKKITIDDVTVINHHVDAAFTTSSTVAVLTNAVCGETYIVTAVATIALPPVATAFCLDKTITVVATGAFNVGVAPNGAENINASNSAITVNNGSKIFLCDGSEWWVVAAAAY